MGKVWLAEHDVLDTTVVVKLMAKEMESHASAAARFAREGAVASKVKSPHVVQVFDSGVTEDGIPFIVMELLEGRDLGATIDAEGALTTADIITIVDQLAKALGRAHRVGVIHRDLKPDNIFLVDIEGGEPFVKLLDFGTAKDKRPLGATTEGELVGTPYYMSPEQILGEAIDIRTDIWSLGVVAFEALTGKRPFEGPTVGAITLAIHTTHPKLTDAAPDLPATLDDWFDRACARKPEDRFQSARGAAEAFARAAQGLPAEPEREAETADSTQSLPPVRLRGRTDAPPSDPQSMVPSVARPATTLSSTLAARSTGRHSKTTWIAGAVGVGAIFTVIAILTQQSGTTPAAGGDPAPAVEPLPGKTATATASAIATATATATASATATATATASATAPARVTAGLPALPPARTGATATTVRPAVTSSASGAPPASAAPTANAVEPLPTFIPRRPDLSPSDPSPPSPPSTSPTSAPTSSPPPLPAPPSDPAP